MFFDRTSRRVLAALTLLFIWPVNGTIGLRFHQPYWNNDEHKTFKHCGLDIKAASGMTICAAADGTISFTGSTPEGTAVSIKHANGIRTTYLPLASVLVTKSESVRQGQALGKLAGGGDSSLATPHLHLGAILAGKYIDPESLLDGRFKMDFSQLIRRGNIPPGPVSHEMGKGQTVSGDERSLWEKIIDFVMSLPEMADEFITGIIDAVMAGGRFLLKEFLWALEGFGRIPSAFLNWIGTVRPEGEPPTIPFGRSSGPIWAGPQQDQRVAFDPSGDHAEHSVRIQTDGQIRITDGAGTLIKTIEAQNGSAIWDGLDEAGRIIAEGLYLALSPSGQIAVVEARYH